MDRPRPLAALPAADPRGVARAWLVRRIAAAPLAAAEDLAGGGFADRAPALCGSLLAALGDDGALEALAGAGVGLVAVVAPGGAAGPAALARAGEQLRAAVGSALLPELDPAVHAALHDRLAHAVAELVGGALAAADGDTRGERERAGGVPRADRPARDAAGGGDGTIRVQDARVAADPRAQLTAEAERLVLARARFALLAVEVEDAAVVPAGILAAAEAALRGALPPGAVQAPDGPGSLLVLAPGADGARLARELTRAVGDAASHRGAPLRAAAGVAEHPRDSDTPEALLAHADGQLFAARAEGLPLI